MDSDRGENTGMDTQVTGTGMNEDIRYKCGHPGTGMKEGIQYECGHPGTGMDVQVVQDLWTRI